MHKNGTFICVCAKFAHMGIDADQVYETTYYNLDATNQTAEVNINRDVSGVILRYVPVRTVCSFVS